MNYRTIELEAPDILIDVPEDMDDADVERIRVEYNLLRFWEPSSSAQLAVVDSLDDLCVGWTFDYDNGWERR